MNADTTAKCAYLFDALKKKGVKSIEIGFYGSGDDGQTEWQNVDWVNDKSSEESEEVWNQLTIFSGGRENASLGELVEEIVEGVLDFYDIDYQNNEGNNGGVVFDVEAGKIKTTYQVYETKEESLYI